MRRVRSVMTSDVVCEVMRYDEGEELIFEAMTTPQMDSQTLMLQKTRTIASKTSCHAFPVVKSANYSPGISHNNSPQPLRSTKYSPPRNRIPPLPTFPPPFSTPLFLAPTLIFHSVPVTIPSEPSCAFHERNLALVVTFNPAVYTSVAVHEACWRGCGCDDWCYANRTKR